LSTDTTHINELVAARAELREYKDIYDLHLRTLAHNHRIEMEGVLDQLRREREAHVLLQETNRKLNRRNQGLEHSLAIETGRKAWKGYYEAVWSVLLDDTKKHEAQVAQLSDQLRREREAREHVAWMRYKKRGGSDESFLVLCDSDAPGAFKVYR
jgi:hypothetical protein